MAATSPAAPGFRGWPVRRGTRRRTARRVRDQRSHPTSGRCSASAGDCGFVSDVDLARAGGSGCHPGARARARVAVDSSGAGTGGPRRPVLGGTRRACGPPRRAISPSSTLADTAGADRGERPGADQRARIVVADRSRRRRRLLSRCRDDPAGRHCPAAAGRTGCSGCDAAVRDRIFRCRQPDHRAADGRLSDDRCAGSDRAQCGAARLGADQHSGAPSAPVWPGFFTGGRAAAHRGRCRRARRGAAGVDDVRRRIGSVDSRRNRGGPTRPCTCSAPPAVVASSTPRNLPPR